MEPPCTRRVVHSAQAAMSRQIASFHSKNQMRGFSSSLPHIDRFDHVADMPTE